MKYFIDCEFDGFDGPLLSMAIVSETGKSMYVVMNQRATDPWVIDNVVPLMLQFDVNVPYPCVLGASEADLTAAIGEFFKADAHPHVIADWPDDLKYFCRYLITGPGTMLDIYDLKMSVRRKDAYPTDLPGAVQHNAWWDAMALRHLYRDEVFRALVERQAR